MNLFISSNSLSQILKLNSTASTSLKAWIISIFHDSKLNYDTDSQEDKVEDDQGNPIHLGRPVLEEGQEDEGGAETDAQSGR